MLTLSRNEVISRTIASLRSRWAGSTRVFSRKLLIFPDVEFNYRASIASAGK